MPSGSWQPHRSSSSAWLLREAGNEAVLAHCLCLTARPLLRRILSLSGVSLVHEVVVC
jgi:hypothetical protein